MSTNMNLLRGKLNIAFLLKKKIDITGKKA